MYWMAARLTSPDWALRAMPQNWSMPHRCWTKGKQAQKQNIASLLYWEWGFFDLRHSFYLLTQSLTTSHFLHCLHCHHCTHQLLQNSLRNSFKVTHEENWLKFKTVKFHFWQTGVLPNEAIKPQLQSIFIVRKQKTPQINSENIFLLSFYLWGNCSGLKTS